jgi:hypothetical protein
MLAAVIHDLATLSLQRLHVLLLLPAYQAAARLALA